LSWLAGGGFRWGWGYCAGGKIRKEKRNEKIPYPPHLTQHAQKKNLDPTSPTYPKEKKGSDMGVGVLVMSTATHDRKEGASER